MSKADDTCRTKSLEGIGGRYLVVGKTCGRRVVGKTCGRGSGRIRRQVSGSEKRSADGSGVIRRHRCIREKRSAEGEVG